MIVFGGWRQPDNWTDRDEWENSLAVFDLTELRWTSEYNPEADEYVFPRLVQEWYNR